MPDLSDINKCNEPTVHNSVRGEACKACGESNVGNIVSNILKCVSKNGKAKIKIEIEVSKD